MDCRERHVARRDAQAQRGQLKMSYILDALKKSEAQRSRGVVPTLLTSSPTQFRPRVAVWVLFGALITNACLVTGWIFWRSPATIAVVPLEGATVHLPTAGASPTAVAPLENPVPASRIATTLPPNEAPISAATAFTTTDAEREAPAQIAASASPQISFSTHVYADDPTMRAVTLNGRRYVEGDTISAGVVLKQITETGVMLDMNGQIIAMDVLQDWR